MAAAAQYGKGDTPYQRDSLARQLFNAPISMSETGRLLLELDSLGLNVFFLPYASKQPYRGFSTKSLQRIKLPANLIIHLADQRQNLAVMTGETSGNLFVIDCETSHAFYRVITALQVRHIPVWAVRSGGLAGGGHIYLRCAAGEVENLPLARDAKDGKTAGHMPDIEIHGYGRYVVTVGSVHPDTGAIYDYHLRECDSPPYIQLPQLDGIFTDVDGLPIALKIRRKRQSRHVDSPRHARMSSKTRAYLANGHTHTKGTRNRSLFIAACDMVGCGFSESEIMDSAGRNAVLSGLDERAVKATVKSACSQPRKSSKSFYGDTLTLSPLKIYCASLRQFANYHQWQGRTGTSDRAVFEALIQRCELGGYQSDKHRFIFRASVRELAELAHCNKMTVVAVLKRLQRDNFLQWLGRKDGFDKTSGAKIYAFGSAVQLREIDTLEEQKMEVSSVSNSLNSDYLERGAIGQNGYRLWRVLVASLRPLSRRELAQMTNLRSEQIRYLLKPDMPLRAFELVVQIGRGLYIGKPATEKRLAEIAEALGKAGKGEKRHENNQLDRARRIAASLDTACQNVLNPASKGETKRHKKSHPGRERSDRAPAQPQTIEYTPIEQQVRPERAKFAPAGMALAKQIPKKSRGK